MQYGHESKFIQTKFYILYFFFSQPNKTVFHLSTFSSSQPNTLGKTKSFFYPPLFHHPNQTELNIIRKCSYQN